MDDLIPFFTKHPEWKDVSVGNAILAVREMPSVDWNPTYLVYRESRHWHTEPIRIQDGMLQSCEAILPDQVPEECLCRNCHEQRGFRGPKIFWNGKNDGANVDRSAESSSSNVESWIICPKMANNDFPRKMATNPRRPVMSVRKIIWIETEDVARLLMPLRCSMSCFLDIDLGK
jgi:hypothetical protein